MNIILITEHFKPLMGGSITYIENVAKSLALRNNVVLIFPSKSETKFVEYKVICIGIGIELINSSFTRKSFYDFVNKVNIRLELLTKDYNIEIVHVLTGWIIHEKLNLDLLRRKGIICLFTVHNVPPRESSKAWIGEDPFLFLFDRIRMFLYMIYSWYRLFSNEFDQYLVPSEDVNISLKKIRPNINVQILAHGINNNILNYIHNSSQENEKVSILTVGGFVPHKNQLLIAKVSNQLKQIGFNFKWTLVGPIRNTRYYEALKKYIFAHDLSSFIDLKSQLSESDLYDLYNNADMYVQPSKEEGFCFAALDALAFSLPIIGTDVGEIKKFIEISSGKLVKMNIKSISNAILSIQNKKLMRNDGVLSIIDNNYNWDVIIKRLESIYINLIVEQRKGI